MKIKNICVVTGSRAEYGLLKPLLTKIKASKNYNLQLVVTGMHLSKKFGNTINEIENDNFNIFQKIDILPEKKSNFYVGKTISNGIEQFSKFFIKHSPDILIVLGDRYEIFACSAAAYFLKIPIAHINGGETTEGAFDEGIRHSITKMSYLHFTSTENYKKRVIQLGEDPNRVFNVGGLFLDSIKESKILSKKELESDLNIVLQKKNLIVTYHPETLSSKSQKKSFTELLNALHVKNDINLIFTSPNADPGNDEIFEAINSFVRKNRHRSSSFKSLGHLRYFSLLNYVDGVIGNSSSGITEAPAFNIGTINIGDRQTGRIKGESIIDCDSDAAAIEYAINKLYSKNFQSIIKDIKSPYGDGTASLKILDTISKISIKDNMIKSFYDINI
tara:strand:- start:1962 stop:3128 length:1167 start_codon:yes stop_codon:yes gene_type:complete